MKKRGVIKVKPFSFDSDVFSNFLIIIIFSHLFYLDILKSFTPIISDSSCALKVHFLVMRLLGTIFLVTKPCLVLVLSILI